jgi:hypothetical protein
MGNESRYHIAVVRKRRSWNHDSIRNHDAIRERDGELRARKEKYEQEKRERLILGDCQEGPKAAHNIRMREIETLFDLQSDQLLKLVVCEDILQPTEDMLNAICRQLQLWKQEMLGSLEA